MGVTVDCAPMRIDDHREPGPPPSRHPDDIAHVQAVECLGRGRATLRGTFAGKAGLAVLQRPAEARVLREVAEMTVHRLAVAVERFLVTAQLPGQPDDRS